MKRRHQKQPEPESPPLDLGFLSLPLELQEEIFRSTQTELWTSMEERREAQREQVKGSRTARNDS